MQPHEQAVQHCRAGAPLQQDASPSAKPASRGMT